MSTFGGRIEEFPGISIDQFEGDNLESSMYFLSHVHSDHMHGFSSLMFRNRLANGKLYCYASEVTAQMLRKWYPDIAENCRHLSLNVRHHLNFANDGYVSVTLLPAGHCLGSVMFLFQNDKHTILYTGDFRLNVAEFKLFKGLYTPGGTLKNITKIHLDTTFMLRKYAQFPTRQESIEALCTLIGEWIELSPEHRIHLHAGCKYGNEYIFNEVHKRFGVAIHVSEAEHATYKYFPNMDKCITPNKHVQVHANCGRAYGTYCNEFETAAIPTRRIKVSAMAWKDWCKNTKLSCEDKNFHRVCYSSHASYKELLAFLDFLEPNEIEPNVNQRKEHEQQEMMELIQMFLDEKTPPAVKKRKPCQVDFIDLTVDEDEESLKLLKINNKQKETVKEDHGFDLSLLDD